jgi:NhaA family Na+:H+ antiporter
VAGDLREPARAAVPILAALGGVAVPALVYVAVNLASGGDGLRGWAIPTATDIAFALAVLAIIGSHLPAALRTFLLTLAVVDDLVAVTIIGVFYTSALHLLPLLAALGTLGLFALAVQRGVRRWWVLLPLALATWVLMHASGVHATVAGVLLGFTVPVLASRRTGTSDTGTPDTGTAGTGTSGREGDPGPAERLEHLFRPLSAGFAVPVFAFLAGGVALGGASGLVDSFTDPVALGVIAGLVLGKPVGILGTAWLAARFTHATLDEGLDWLDVLGIAALGGIGFTVSLLIGDLAFGESASGEHVKAGILTGSLGAALLGAVLVTLRDRAHRRRGEAEASP